MPAALHLAPWIFEAFCIHYLPNILQAALVCSYMFLLMRYSPQLMQTQQTFLGRVHAYPTHLHQPYPKQTSIFMQSQNSHSCKSAMNLGESLTAL
ncbi:hypothetical protein QBC35DRAFT_494240 [Podospora australis]|uniref:Uncharacterized protein n=1 Tax=Podospora australis TaxID=1536484 RepID=A0AAN6X048_9PEZI|nr:hypothetical protein QBC35DRAFT_494240 [Podospora australis]